MWHRWFLERSASRGLVSVNNVSSRRSADRGPGMRQQIICRAGGARCKSLSTPSDSTNDRRVCASLQRCRRLHFSRVFRRRDFIRHARSNAVTPIFVRPVETPALCHVVPAETTSKPCESVAEYRTRLSLPYLLRRTSLLPAAGEEHAKYQSANTASRLASDASETLTSGDEPFGFEVRPGF